MPASDAPARWAERLADLGRVVRNAVAQSRRAGSDMSEVVGQMAGDTIFAIDRVVEPLVTDAIASWPAECKPLVLVAEGQGTVFFGQGEPKYRLIIDPIDGTRNLMYDKRSAWFLAAVCENAGEETTISDSVASAMVELSTSKAGFADTFMATREGVRGQRESLLQPGVSEPLEPRPSRSPTLRGGFGQVANFFPGTKVLAAELMQRIVDATLGPEQPGGASVFDDQYISTGGQFVELMMGRDRFCCDLRPLFYRVLERRQPASGRVRGLQCHPYDMAGWLVAERAGVVFTDGLGGPLRPPLDVHSGVHWCGYANEALRSAIEPVIRQFFEQRGVSAP